MTTYEREMTRYEDEMTAYDGERPRRTGGMRAYESPLAVVAKGAISGLVGTAVLTVAMQNAPMMMEKLGLTPPQEPKPADQGEGESLEPTAELAERVATGVLETPVDQETVQTAGQAIHWGYGATWGMLYGVVQGTLQAPPLVHGALFGTAVGLVASTVVPAMKLAPPPKEQPTQQNVMQMMMHLLFGWVTAATYDVLSPRT